jgi:hypothetical protein
MSWVAHLLTGSVAASTAVIVSSLADGRAQCPVYLLDVDQVQAAVIADMEQSIGIEPLTREEVEAKFNQVQRFLDAAVADGCAVVLPKAAALSGGEDITLIVSQSIGNE